MFQQIFLEKSLYQSPDNIISKEKLAYKGGRTEVFKKEFKSNSNKNKNISVILMLFIFGQTV